MSGMTADNQHGGASRPIRHRGFIVTMMALAVVTAAGGAWLRHREDFHASRMIQVRGRIVSQDIQCRRNGWNSSCRYFPWVVFHTPEGLRASFRSSVGSSGRHFVDGQRVPVLYDPGGDTPADTAYIRDYGMRISSFVWLIAAGFAATGVLVRILPEKVRSDTPEDVVEAASAPSQRRHHAPRRPH